jgi:hypothetical protein
VTRGGAAYLLHAVLALGVEIAVLVAVFRLGSTMIPGWAGLVAGLFLLACVIVLWGRWGAPKSGHRLTSRPLLVFKIAIFTLGAAAFWAVDGALVAMIFTVICVLHLALAVAIDAL